MPEMVTQTPPPGGPPGGPRPPEGRGPGGPGRPPGETPPGGEGRPPVEPPRIWVDPTSELFQRFDPAFQQVVLNVNDTAAASLLNEGYVTGVTQSIDAIPLPQEVKRDLKIRLSNLNDRIQQAKLAREITARRAAQQQELEEQAGFRTFSAQYLTEIEKENIKARGPEYWEELYEEIMTLLTIDPNSDVLRDQAFISKLSALQEFIRSQGRKYYADKGYSPEEADAAVEKWSREIIVDQNERIHAHNALRAVLMTNDAKRNNEVYGSISNALYEKLSGRSIIDNPLRQQIVADANRLYEQAMMAEVAKKYRRYMFLKDKLEKTGRLTPTEQHLLDSGYYLSYVDLIPQTNIWETARHKHRRLTAWDTVRRRMNTESLNEKDAIKKLLQLSKEKWPLVEGRMREKHISEREAVQQMLADQVFNDQTQPEYFTEEDVGLYYEIEREMHEQGVTRAQLGEAYTEEEKRLLKAELFYSPVEMRVHDEVRASAEVRLRQELIERREQGIFADELEKRHAKGETRLTLQDVEQEWFSRDMHKVMTYSAVAVSMTRAHMTFARRVQKVNALFSDLPPGGAEGLEAPNLENEIRFMHPILWFMRRFGYFGLPAARDMASIAGIMQFNNKVAKELKLDDMDEWKQLVADALAKRDDEEKPRADKGLDDIVAYIKKETGIAYRGFLETSFVPIGGVYDVSMWRKQLIELEPVQQILTALGKMGAMNNEDRFEYSLGIQFAVADYMNTSEVDRGADDYANLRILLQRILTEQGTPGIGDDAGSSDVINAKKYLRTRLTVNEKKKINDPEQIQQMIVLLDQYRQDPTGANAKNIKELFKDEHHFKGVKKELEIERKKEVLHQMASRLPSVIASYFAEDIQSRFDELFRANDVIRTDPDVRYTGAEQDFDERGRLFGKEEKIWAGFEKALTAIQNDIVRKRVSNRELGRYFGQAQEEGFVNFDSYLRQFLSDVDTKGRSDYEKYGVTCHQMKDFLRHYFQLMQRGEAGKAVAIPRLLQKQIDDARDAGKTSEVDELTKELNAYLQSGEEGRKFVGMRQFNIIARYPMDMTLTMADARWEETTFALWGSQASAARRGGEGAGSVDAAQTMINIYTHYYRQDFGKTSEELGKFMETVAGWTSPDTAGIPGQSILEAWIEMIKAPDFLNAFPWLEGGVRQLVESDFPSLKKWALRHGSRLVQITENPQGPILQPDEKRELFEIIRSIDAFMQRPETLEYLFKKHGVTNPELRAYALYRALPYVLIAMALLMAAQVKQAAKTGGEESH